VVSNLNPNIYFDGAYFSAVPDSVRNEIAKYSKQKDVDSGRISFCGFVYEDESFHLFLPKGSEKVVNFQDARGCKKFCVNSHFAGNCYFQKWIKNDLTKSFTQ